MKALKEIVEENKTRCETCEYKDTDYLGKPICEICYTGDDIENAKIEAIARREENKKYDGIGNIILWFLLKACSKTTLRSHAYNTQRTYHAGGYRPKRRR